MSEIPNSCCSTDEYQCPQCEATIKVFRHKADTPRVQKVTSGPHKGNLLCKCGYFYNFKIKLNDGSFA